MATVENYGSISTITDTTIAGIMAEIKGKSSSCIISIFYDAANTLIVAVIKNQ